MKLLKLPEINKEGFLRLLPSKKFGFYLLLVLCVPIFAFILFSRGGVVARVVALINGTKTPQEIASLQAEALLDSDSDGLDDWQEALWKTDFKNPDTDNDGTKDGEEVSSNRNPLVAGPNDSFAETIAALKENGSSTANDNLTDELSKTLLTKYITTKKVLGGNTVGEEEKEKITNSALAEIDLTNNATKLFSANDLKTTSDNSIASVRTYGNAISTVAKNYTSKVDPLRDAAVVKEAIGDDSPEDILSLSESLKVYNETENSLLKIVVPTSLAEKHLAILNTFHKNGENTKNMMMYFSDPIKALLALTSQGDEIKNLIESFVSLNNYFASAGILFKNTEPGFFMQTNANNLSL